MPRTAGNYMSTETRLERAHADQTTTIVRLQRELEGVVHDARVAAAESECERAQLKSELRSLKERCNAALNLVLNAQAEVRALSAEDLRALADAELSTRQ